MYILLPVFHFFRYSCLTAKHRAGEMESASKSFPKSHRVREFLPSVKPSYQSLILVFVCWMNLLRNESTNDRLLTLEKQMKILTSSKCGVETGPQSSNEEMSNKPSTESVILVRNTGKPKERYYYPTGKNLHCSKLPFNVFQWSFDLVIHFRSYKFNQESRSV